MREYNLSMLRQRQNEKIMTQNIQGAKKTTIILEIYWCVNLFAYPFSSLSICKLSLSDYLYSHGPK